MIIWNRNPPISLDFKTETMSSFSVLLSSSEWEFLARSNLRHQGWKTIRSVWHGSTAVRIGQKFHQIVAVWASSMMIHDWLTSLLRHSSALLNLLSNLLCLALMLKYLQKLAQNSEKLSNKVHFMSRSFLETLNCIHRF